MLLALEEVKEAEFKGAYTLQPLQSLLSGYNESLEVLGNRIRNAIDVVSLTRLSFRLYTHSFVSSPMRLTCRIKTLQQK